MRDLSYPCRGAIRSYESVCTRHTDLGSSALCWLLAQSALQARMILARN